MLVAEEEGEARLLSREDTPDRKSGLLGLLLLVNGR